MTRFLLLFSLCGVALAQELCSGNFGKKPVDAGLFGNSEDAFGGCTQGIDSGSSTVRIERWAIILDLIGSILQIIAFKSAEKK